MHKKSHMSSVLHSFLLLHFYETNLYARHFNSIVLIHFNGDRVISLCKIIIIFVIKGEEKIALEQEMTRRSALFHALVSQQFPLCSTLFQHDMKLKSKSVQHFLSVSANSCS